MKNNNKKINNLEMYLYLIKRFNFKKHEVIEIMKKNKQDVSFLN